MLFKRIKNQLARAWNYTSRNRLLTGERFVPLEQQDVPWAVPHLKRYRFAAEFSDQSSSVTDIACGVGYASEIFTGKCRAYCGIDGNKRAIDYAREHYEGEFECMDFFSYSKTADLVVSLETIEHIDRPLADVLNFLVSRANKILVGSIPYREAKGKNPFHCHSELTEENLKPLSEHGDLRVYYQEQEPGGDILEELSDKTQNLVFVLTKAH